MYHGAICSGRGIEECLDVLTLDENLCLILMGKVQSNKYKSELDNQIERYNLHDRVRFYESVSNEVLWKYVGAADIEMVMVQPIVRSYFFGLPNKLFEAIQAHIPIVATDLPEIRRIVEEYKVGELCEKYDVKDAYRAVKRILDNKTLKKEYIDNEKKAADELCWEVESDKLRKEYMKIWKYS